MVRIHKEILWVKSLLRDTCTHQGRDPGWH